jgi:hypothetical protein
MERDDIPCSSILPKLPNVVQEVRRKGLFHLKMVPPESEELID